MNKSKARLSISCVCLSVFILPLVLQRHQPYIDPGTGSLVIQILIASFLGALFTIKLFWTKVKAFFLRHLFNNVEPGASKHND
jgi:hypothetical protein